MRKTLLSASVLAGLLALQERGLGSPDQTAVTYGEAFALADTLPRDSEEFVRSATRESVERIEEALALTRSAARAGSVDWGMDWELEGFDAIDYEAPGKVRNLARLGVTYHRERLKRGDYEGFAEDMEALLRMGQHFSEGQVLIAYLTAMATDGIVRSTIIEHAAQLPDEVRDDLLGRLKAMPEGPALAEVFDVEKAALRGQLWNVFAGTAELGEDAPEESHEDEGLADRLRVSSIVEIGGEVWGVGFEDAESGETFRLRPGESRGDLRLLSVDAGAGRALISQGEKTVVVEMAGRKLLPFDPREGWERILQFGDELAGTVEFWSGEKYDAGFDRFLDEAGGDELAAFDALLGAIEEEMEQMDPLLSMGHEELPPAEEAAAGMGVYGQTLAPTLVRVRKAELRSGAERELLLTGLAHLQDPEADMPVSEVTGEPIRRYRENDRLIFESTFPDTRYGREGPLRIEIGVGPEQ